MKKTIKIIAASLGALVTLAAVAVFVYIPTVFEAKYDGTKFVTADGKELVTIVRLPDGSGPFPTLIVRSPYELPHTPLSGMPSEDFTDVADADLGKVGWAPVTEAGYALVIQHTRGRIGSDGTALGVKDREDALELIAWVKEQPWSNGKIGTTGDSIEAIMAMLTNAENPRDVGASFVQIGTPNLINDVMIGPGGALKLETFLPWTAEQILTADDTHFKEMGFGPIKRRTARVQMGLKAQQLLSDLDNPHDVKAWQHLPLKDYPHFADASEAWNRMLDARPGSEVANHFDASDTNIPTFYVAAWFDVFGPSQISSFARAERFNRDQRLLILNGTHFDPENPGAWPIKPMLPWFDYHLKGETSALMGLPRVIFPIANGDDEWFGADTWPLEDINTSVWSLSPSGELLQPGGELADSGLRAYEYDPDNPVPTVGGRNLLISHGPLDQRSVRQDKRADVLSYEGEVLTKDVVIAGPVYGQVSVTSSAPDTDFTIKILDISPDGTATLVTEGIQRARFREGLGKEVFMEAGEVYQLRIDLGQIAWRFKPGHKIAVDVSSSNFPQWDRNLNTDAPLFSSTERQVARNTIHHGTTTGSFIELPVIDDLEQLNRLEGFKTNTGK